MFVFSRARISRRAAVLACLLLLSLGLNLLIENLVLIDARRPTFWRYFLIHYGLFVVALSVAIWVCARALARPISKAIAGVRRVAMSSGSQRFVARGVLCTVAACYLLCGISVWWSFARRPAKEDLAGLAAYLDKRATPFDEIRFQPRWRSLPLRLYRLYADKDICEPRSGVMWHVQYISTDPKPEQMDSVRKFSGLVLWRRGPASLEPEDLYKEFSSKITGRGTFILFGVPRSPGLRRHLRDMLSTRDRVIDFAEDAADDLLDENAIYMVWDGRSLHNRTDEAKTLLSEYSSGLLQLSKIGSLPPNRAVAWESKSTRTLPNGDLEIFTTSKPWSLLLSRDSNIPASVLKAVRVRLGYFPVNPDREYSDTYRRFSFRETMDLKPGQTETKREAFSLWRVGRMETVDIRMNRPPEALYLKTLTISPAHQPQAGDRVIWGGYTLLPKKPAEHLAAHLHL